MPQFASQVRLPWRTAVAIAGKSLRKRLARSLITMASVVLAIAFLMNIWSGNAILAGLRQLDDPSVRDLLLRHGALAAGAAISRKTMWLVCLSLLVCAIGIVNAMLMSVTERFREIGTMKCLGALDVFVVRIFLLEAAFQGVVGGALGICVGLIAGVANQSLIYGWPAVAVLGNGSVALAVAIDAALCLLLSTALCTIFAVYPAYVAAAMQPADAMRMEE